LKYWNKIAQWHSILSCKNWILRAVSILFGMGCLCI
jgi:hypothetical protein